MEGQDVETMRAEIIANIDKAIETLQANREAVKRASHARRLAIYRTLSRHDAETVKDEQGLIS